MDRTDHQHCPLGCEHPQEFRQADGRLVCGRCAIVEGVLTEMVPCTPATCPDGGRDAGSG